MLTHEEIVAIGKHYGFSIDILGYPDTESQLCKMALYIYMRGFNAGVKQERELDFLDYYADETGVVH